ncbi:hypothetical protein EV193_103622 [Herbihabitans rhizosphaerae]|uniref:Uncharacterized protein n=1 Tax=Herbihabitans rhizosphaerae TaxID=1872711 RepID=A0A4Q7KY62_9PSEU|nr:hypothetical protein [Herbihabitans rhizosphaerae]RZS41300.1 hypothetical protein EV193_103622 [Herbihabitans rhizosphaerae]
MTQVVDRVSLPIRIHDLLLALAGRIDDDGLSDARELVASAELDRSLEMIAGCLTAGGIPVTPTERDELRRMFSEAHCDDSVIENLVVATVAAPPHRFAPGEAGPAGADQGVADAVRRVLDVLPDVRAVHAVWRLTPAGAATGPVPHRVVLIEIGADGFAPATSYRVENALRRAGIRATVEVVAANGRRQEYHRAALAKARMIDVGVSAGSSLPERTSRPSTPPPAKPAAPAEPAPRAETPPPARRSVEEPVRDKPVSQDKPRETVPPPTRVESTAQIPKVPAEPAPRAEKPVAPAEPPKPVEERKPEPVAEATKPEPTTPSSTPSSTDSAMSSFQSFTDRPDLTERTDRTDPPEQRPDRTESVANPKRGDSASRRSKDVDADLSDQERDLLRQLHEELAKREQADSTPSASRSSSTGRWQVDRSGRERGESSMINGIPPEQPPYPG